MAVSVPRCYVGIGDARIPCLTADVSRTAKRSSDQFQVTFSATKAAKLGFPLDFWADFQPTQVSVIMSSKPGGGDERVMVTGLVDTPAIDFTGMRIEISSRDQSAKLAETKRSKKYPNQKSADIVQDIAQDAGLQVSATSGDDDAGQVYDQDTNHLIRNRSDYETLNDLAEREGYRWYVDGNTLYFEPEDQTNGEFNVLYVPPVVGTPAQANVLKLTTKRNMTAARPQKHTARSWHKKDKKLYTHTEQIGGVGSPVEHFHDHNGLNQKGVERVAKSRLKNAARHDMQVFIDMPGDLSADVRMKLNLSGTGTKYDQSYDIDAIKFRMAWEGGFVMSMEAKGMKAGRA